MAQTDGFGRTNRPSTIALKVMATPYDEARAAAVLKPGHWVKYDGNKELVLHNVASGEGEAMIVTEDCLALIGKGIDDSYAVGDLVSFRILRSGDEALLWLTDGQNIDEGDHLVSTGSPAGEVKKYAAPAAATDQFVVKFTAMEALDLTGVGNTTAQRLKARRV